MRYEFLTKKEAAERARCSQRFLEHRIKEGALAATILGPHKILIRSDCLQAWLERCTSTSSVGAPL